MTDVLSIYPTRDVGGGTFAEAGETSGYGEKLASFAGASVALPFYLGYRIAQQPDAYADLVSTAERHTRLVDTLFSEDAAREEAYERRIRAVKAATGLELENPERGGYSLSEKDRRRLNQENGGPIDPVLHRRQQFENLLAGVRSDNPDKSAELQFGDIGEETRAIAQGAEQAYARARSNPKLDPAAALLTEFAGGMYGMRRDPLFMATLPSGPTGAAGRTVGARILSAGMRQALYNAGLTALEQPTVQAWRQQIGSQYGFMPAVENIGLAAVVGLIPGMVFRGAHELTAPSREALERVVAGAPEPGDIEKVIQTIHSVQRELLPGAPPGANIAARDVAAARLGEDMDAAARATQAPPEKAIPEPVRGDLADAAIRHAEDPVNEPSAGGVAAAAEPLPAKPKPKKGPAARNSDTWSLLEFIASRGGIRADDANIGDVRVVLGKDNKFIPGFGPLVRKNGLPLDRLREAAVEAGYIFDEGFNSDKAATTTLRDLLDHMDREERGEKVYRQGYEPPPNRSQMLDAWERQLDADLAAAEILPSSVDAKLRKRTFQIMEREGVSDPLLAYEQAVMEDATGVQRSKRPIPGWDEPVLDDTGGAPAASRGDVRGGEAGPGAAPHEPSQADREAPQPSDVQTRIAEAEPTSQREAAIAADEALDDIGRREAITIAQRQEAEAAQARIEAAAAPPPAKAPKGDALGKVPWTTPEGKPTTIAEASVAKVGARELELADLIKACK